MIRKIGTCLAALGLLGCLAGPAAAAQVESGEIYCFSPEDFSPETLQGICITQVPDPAAGALTLGSRHLLPGDVLAADQLAQVTFSPALAEQDRAVEIGYLPIREDTVGAPAVMTLSIRGRENKAPAAEDFALETYKNLSVQDKLRVSDPEGEEMTYTLVRQGKRGTVELNPDGSFTYTPKKNKVGIDSFVYTATDASGKVSREATVTVTILKTTQGAPYTDTAGLDCRFAAEWMRNTGIFVGEQVDGNACFRPQQTVTRGEFTVMMVKALELMEEEAGDFSGYTDEIPVWLRPYAAAAVRSGLTAGLPDRQTFRPEEVITWSEAAVMAQNHLDLPVTAGQADPAEAAWAVDAVTCLTQAGLPVQPEAALTRADAALLLHWLVSQSRQ